MKGLTDWVGRLQWRRGVRALVAVGAVLVVCFLLGRAPAAAALGATVPLLVDSGGPYRTRLATMLTALLAGAAALILGVLLPVSLWVVVPVTLLVCFGLTYARVISQPIASTSVLILVLYFAGLGGATHTWAGALIATEMVLGGGVWAIALSLVLWPVDAFRPARLAVANCYSSLATFTAGLGEMTEAGAHEWQRGQRTRMEEARTALSATRARAPSRTIRARNLTVLLETADMLLARTMRLTELSVQGEFAGWLAGAEREIGRALLARPADAGASFGRDGSHWMQWLGKAPGLAGQATESDAVARHMAVEERDARLEVGVAFEAVRAIWSGVDQRRMGEVDSAGGVKKGWDWTVVDSTSADAVAANWTLKSANMRHALRLMVVGMLDVLAMRAIHVNHGFWLPMTSIILMQPFSAGTNRKSVQRVSGTIAGGVLAAVLAAVLPSQAAMIPVITVLAGLTLATFAVDYAVYCFFLTPTFVLMSLPHPHDWRYAGIRMGTTLVGAAIAVLAMKLLWPERAEVELAGLLRRGAAADAAYLEAMLRFWEVAPAKRRAAERTLLAPARRACGMASNDAEEAVDRVMQEPHFGLGGVDALAEQALTFTTYLRRLTQSITTVAPLGRDTPEMCARVEALARRLGAVAEGRVVGAGTARGGPVLVDVVEEQLQRMERQVGVLEKYEHR